MLIKHSIPMQRKNIVKDGLVLWLEGKDFTNSPPTSQLRDRSGNGNNATPSGFAYTLSSGSDNNGGVMFDGVNDDFRVNNVGDNDNTFTAEVKFIGNRIITSDKTIISKANNTSSGAKFIIDLVGGSTMLRFFGFNSVNSVIGDSVGVNIDSSSMVHGTFVYDGANMKTYVNGILKKSIPFTDQFKAITNNFNIGNRCGSRLFDNTMYMVRYYNRALIDTEILQNYNATK